MNRRSMILILPLMTLVVPGRASAQIVEAVGSQALGMGGAFVAVASDSSATWWNPGALPAGPFLVDLAIAGATTDSSRHLPAERNGAGWFAVAGPMVGFSYYRVRIAEARSPSPTAPGEQDREDGQGTVPVRALSASEYGVSLAHTLLTGVHLGTTLKYVRGTPRGGFADAQLPVSGLLDAGEELEGGDADDGFDFDIGLMAVAGPMRAGLVIRNVREVSLGTPGTPGGEFRLPRQVRIGAAFDGDQVGTLPLTVSLDVDVLGYPTVSGDRRVVAVGAEHWLIRKRLALRGGGRFNTAGAEDRAATAGITVALRPGLIYLDGHLVRGGAADDRGWGMAARVSL